MNTVLKTFIAIFAAINVVFGILIPISVALLLIVVFEFNTFQQSFLIFSGSISSLFRAINVGFIKGEEK